MARHVHNVERLVSEQLLAQPNGVEVERIYAALSDIPRPQVDEAIESLRAAGVLCSTNASRLRVIQPVAYLETLGLVGAI